MSAALTAIANTTIELTAADAFGGFVALIVGIISFLSISGLAISMTVGASKSPSTMAITGAAGLFSVIVAVGLYMTLSGTHAPKLEDCPVKTWDQLGGIFALIIGSVGLLCLVGIAAVMTIGAFMPSKQPATSWPMAEEQAFTGYDRRTAQSQSQAWVFGIVAATVLFVFAFGVYKGVDPEQKDLSKDMNMSNLTKKSKTDAPKPDAPKPEAPKKEEPKSE
jgi:hypothetical protein